MSEKHFLQLFILNLSLTCWSVLLWLFMFPDLPVWVMSSISLSPAVWKELLIHPKMTFSRLKKGPLRSNILGVSKHCFIALSNYFMILQTSILLSPNIRVKGHLCFFQQWAGLHTISLWKQGNNPGVIPWY